MFNCNVSVIVNIGMQIMLCFDVRISLSVNLLVGGATGLREA